MLFHRQMINHDPENGQWGDCFRTALACVLDMEVLDVPHFCDGDPDTETFSKLLNGWLSSRGIAMFDVPYDSSLDDLLRVQSVLNANVYYLLSGESRRGVNHTVVCRGGEIVHDPAGDSGIIGPCIDRETPEHDRKFYWVQVVTHCQSGKN